MRRARSVVLSSASTLAENAGSGPSVNTVKTGMLGIGREMVDASSDQEPTVEGRNLLSVAHKNVIFARRSLKFSCCTSVVPASHPNPPPSTSSPSPRLPGASSHSSTDSNVTLMAAPSGKLSPTPTTPGSGALGHFNLSTIDIPLPIPSIPVFTVFTDGPEPAFSANVDTLLSTTGRAWRIAWIAHVESFLGDLVSHVFYCVPANYVGVMHPTLSSFYKILQSYYMPRRIHQVYQKSRDVCEKFRVVLGGDAIEALRLAVDLLERVGIAACALRD
ncbi:hypothetical protein BGY98DRAFT_1094324 [Russula aff. rugulosa BPL654]|nr:hypothetical protein BGY98DRAFT_1094324 [Russula aff. rugulosa BPL654]